MTRSIISRRGTAETAVDPIRSLDALPNFPLCDIYAFADYVELRLLLGAENSVTAEETATWFRVDRKDAPDDEPDEAVGQLEDGDERFITTDLDAAERADCRSRLADDVHALLAARYRFYGSDYPFKYVGPERRLVRKKRTTSRHRLYIFLLLCASGRYVTDHNQLTLHFERLAATVVQVLVPTAETHPFGTSATDGLFNGGSFADRAARLAEKLNEELDPRTHSSPSGASGDRGLDVVSWVDMGDGCGGTLAIFGQAACTKNWVEKQSSCTPQAWDRIIQLTSPATAVCAIPFCFRNSTMQWHDGQKIRRTFLLDRWRLMRQLRGLEIRDVSARRRRDKAPVAYIPLQEVDAILTNARTTST